MRRLSPTSYASGSCWSKLTESRNHGRARTSESIGRSIDERFPAPAVTQPIVHEQDAPSRDERIVRLDAVLVVARSDGSPATRGSCRSRRSCPRAGRSSLSRTGAVGPRPRHPQNAAAVAVHVLILRTGIRDDSTEAVEHPVGAEQLVHDGAQGVVSVQPCVGERLAQPERDHVALMSDPQRPLGAPLAPWRRWNAAWKPSIGATSKTRQQEAAATTKRCDTVVHEPTALLVVADRAATLATSTAVITGNCRCQAIPTNVGRGGDRGQEGIRFRESVAGRLSSLLPGTIRPPQCALLGAAGDACRLPSATTRDRGNALCRRRLSLGVLCEPRPPRSRVALPRRAASAARDDRPSRGGQCCSRARVRPGSLPLAVARLRGAVRDALRDCAEGARERYWYRLPGGRRRGVAGPGASGRFRRLQLANFTGFGDLDDVESIRVELGAAGGRRGRDRRPDRRSRRRRGYERQRAEARSAAGTPRRCRKRPANVRRTVRYTAPSVVFRREKGTAFAGGWQPLLAYDTVLANFAPELDRTPPPETPEPLFEHFPGGLTTAEVAALLHTARIRCPTSRRASACSAS